MHVKVVRKRPEVGVKILEVGIVRHQFTAKDLDVLL